MKKYKYVVVAGCSFSACDAPNLPKPGETYCDFIANHYGAEPINLAKSGGSFDLMFRRVMNWCLKNKEHLEDTLVIMGMTSITRLDIFNNKGWDIIKSEKYIGDEFPTKKLHTGTDKYKEVPILDSHTGPWYENYGLSLIFNDDTLYDKSHGHDYPFHHEWPPNERKKYFQNFYSYHSVLQDAIIKIYALQSFFKSYNIDNIFFDAIEMDLKAFWISYCKDDKEDYLGNKMMLDALISNENWYRNPDYLNFAALTISDITMRYSKTDSHPSKEGHKFWANYLIDFLESKV